VFETPLFEWAGRSFGISSSTQLNSDLAVVGKTYIGNVVSREAISSWGNSAELSLPAGQYIITAGLTTRDNQMGKSCTMRIISASGTEYAMRQSIHCSTIDLYSGNLSCIIHLGATDTLYLQSWARDAVSFASIVLIAVRLK